MIIDKILDRKDGVGYSARDLYDYCTGLNILNSEDIARALDSGENYDIQRELCKYIHLGGYNPEICNYINSVDWLQDEEASNKISFEMWLQFLNAER